jgi:hypothetical protein
LNDSTAAHDCLPLEILWLSGVFVPRQTAAAPPTISAISWVMAAWRALL